MVATVGAATEAKRDSFGNVHAPGLSYARGEIIRSTEDDFLKLQVAWRHIRERGIGEVFNFSGLEHGLPLDAGELPIASDFLAPALYFDRFRDAALEHFGGDPERHDAALFNRITAATLATHLALCEPGQTVIGVSASHSHPSVMRASNLADTTLIDTAGVDQFGDALESSEDVGLRSALGLPPAAGRASRSRASPRSRALGRPRARCGRRATRPARSPASAAPSSSGTSSARSTSLSLSVERPMLSPALQVGYLSTRDRGAGQHRQPPSPHRHTTPRTHRLHHPQPPTRPPQPHTRRLHRINPWHQSSSCRERACFCWLRVRACSV